MKLARRHYIVRPNLLQWFDKIFTGPMLAGLVVFVKPVG